MDTLKVLKKRYVLFIIPAFVLTGIIKSAVILPAGDMISGAIPAAGLHVPVPFCLTAYAAGPGEPLESAENEVYEAVDGYVIPADELSDGIIRFEEAGSLVHFYNKDILDAVEDNEKKLDEYSELKDYLVTEYFEAKDEGDSRLEDIYKSGFTSYSSMIKKLTGEKSEKSRRKKESIITNTLQDLLFSRQAAYYSLEEALLDSERLKAELDTAEAKLSAGMITLDTYSKALISWQRSGDTVSRSRLSLDELEKKIKELAGQSGKEMIFAEIERDVSAEAALIDPESDLPKAINIDSSVVSFRHKGGANSEQQAMVNDAQEAKLTDEAGISYYTRYNAVMNALASYQNSIPALQAADEIFRAAELKFQSGMLKKADYLKSSLDHMKKVHSFKSARMSLFQAYLRYQRGMEGM